MASDFTQYLLYKPCWLVAGLFIYFFLTLHKVHLLWYIQPRIYNNKANKNIMSGYWSHFIAILFSNKKLVLNALQYIFRYDKEKFLLVKDPRAERIKKRLNILNGVTFFLKPYLFFATAWLVVDVYISSKIHFNGDTILFGKLQEIIAFVDSIPIIQLLHRYKEIVFLLYGTICVLIPYLYAKKEATKAYKKTASHILIYLSLLANISFFGMQTGKIVHDKNTELKDLKTEITAIHNNIYKTVAVNIQLNDFSDQLEKEEEEFEKEIDRINAIRQATKPVLDSSIYTVFSNTVLRRLARIRQHTTIPDLIPYEATKRVSATDYFKEELRKTKKFKGYTDYLSKRSNWSKRKGESILHETNISIASTNKKSSPFKNKLKKFLEHLFDYSLNTGTGEILSELGLEQHKTLKKIIRIIVSEGYKEKLAAKITSFFYQIKDKDAKDNEALTKTDIDYKLSSNELEDMKKRNNEFMRKVVLMTKNEQLRKNITKKINSLKIDIPDEDKIVSRLKQRFDTYSAEQAIEQARLEGFNLEQGVDIISSIKEQTRNQYKQIFLNYTNQTNLEDYNAFLKKNYNMLNRQKSNLSLKKIAPSLIQSIGQQLCGRCGLPLTFPICLAIR